MTDYIFTLASGKATLHADIDYVTDEAGNRVAYEDGYVIADWSVVPVELFYGHGSFSISSGQLHIVGTGINFALKEPLTSGTFTVSGTSIEIITLRLFQLLSGSINFLGQSIAFDKSGSGNKTFILDPGIVRIGGQSILFTINRVFPITHPTKFKIKTSSIRVIGTAINFTHTISLASGTLRIGGSELTITPLINKVFRIESGTIYLVGKPILFITEPKAMYLGSGEITIGNGNFEFLTYRFYLTTGDIRIGRSPITFLISYQSDAIETLHIESIIDQTLYLSSTIPSTLDIISEIYKELELNGNFYW